jgi:F0F1-type ATP synthase assembly protein I
MMSILALILGSFEVLLVTWLVLVIFNGGGGWFVGGLIAYFAWSAYAGGTLKGMALMLAIAAVLAWVFSSFGVVPAVLTYIGMIAVGEILPSKKTKPGELTE